MKSFFSNLFKTNSTSTTTTSTSTAGSITTTSTIQSNRNRPSHQRAASFIDKTTTTSLSTDYSQQQPTNSEYNSNNNNNPSNSSPLKRKRNQNYSDDTLHDMLESYSPRGGAGKGYHQDLGHEKILLKAPTTPDRSKQLKLTPPHERGLMSRRASSSNACHEENVVSNNSSSSAHNGSRSHNLKRNSSLMMNPLGLQESNVKQKNKETGNLSTSQMNSSKHVHGRSMSLKFLPGQLQNNHPSSREDASNSSLQSPRLPSSPMTSTKQQQCSPARSNGSTTNYNPLETFPQAYKGLEPFCIEASLAKLGKKFNEMIYKQTESWIQASNGEEELKNASSNMKFTRDLLRMSHCMSVDEFEPVKLQQVNSRASQSNLSLQTPLSGKFKRIHDFSQIEDPTLRMIEIINATHDLFENKNSNGPVKFCTLECYQDLTNTFQSQNVQPDDLVNVFRTLCVKRQRHQAASSQMSSSQHKRSSSNLSCIEKPHPMLKVLCLIDQSVVVGTLGQVAQCIMTLKNSISQLPQKEAAVTIDQFKDIRGTWTVTFRDYGDKLSVLHQRTDCMLTKNNPKLFSNNGNRSGASSKLPRSEFLELFHITWQVELFFNSRENPQFIQAIEVSLRDIDWTCSGSRDLHDENSTFIMLTPEQRFEAERICRLFFSVKNEVKRFSQNNASDGMRSVLTQPVKCRLDNIPPHVPGVQLSSLNSSNNNGLTSPRPTTANVDGGNLTSPRRRATPSLRLNYNWFTKLFSSNSNSAQVEDVLAEYVVPTSTSTSLR
ncbi:hypothetical protein C9374_003977 [Naegleria lovaniensis]|uniref:Uncharacterized protein n=1 Tax=Naegleria lovaniensis TaxID=51637 RepID=A0AA88H488_NAELO|nr:uncharacterized protein C9374_003977 [Naegleria lovaniensis]KAG2394213.1 hypothetical protein C9374_003977 [Naegleria lovaniensis]